MDKYIIDLNDISSIRQACSSIGFFYVPFNNIDNFLINDVLADTKKFFNQSDTIKKEKMLNKDGMGYIPLDRMKGEIIEKRELLTGQLNSLKEDSYKRYYKEMLKYSKIIFEKILLSLNLNPSEYEESIMPSYDALTLIHYPVSDVTSYGVTSHTDWGFITILYTTTEGLQIKINGEWIDVPVIPGHFIVNIGDMMQILSNGYYKSTKHRVIVTKEKYSFAFFFEPNTNYVVKPYKKSHEYIPIKYGDYVKQKIKESYKQVQMMNN